MVVVDTNVLIDHLRRSSGDTILKKFIRDNRKKELALSLISIQELYEGKSTEEKRGEEMLLAQVSGFKVLPYDYNTAVAAGKIARDIQIDFANAAIAATAIINNAQLLTLNKKDFQGIDGLSLV